MRKSRVFGVREIRKRQTGNGMRPFVAFEAGLMLTIVLPIRNQIPTAVLEPIRNDLVVQDPGFRTIVETKMMFMSVEDDSSVFVFVAEVSRETHNPVPSSETGNSQKTDPSEAYRNECGPRCKS